MSPNERARPQLAQNEPDGDPRPFDAWLAHHHGGVGGNSRVRDMQSAFVGFPLGALGYFGVGETVKGPSTAWKPSHYGAARR